MITLTGRITDLLVGEEHITNCKFLRWKTIHTIAPRLLPSSKIPVGWFQSHIWVEGEFGLQTLDASITIPSTGDAQVITTFVAKAVSTSGAEKTFTFSGLIIVSVDRDLGGDEPVFVYHFLAYANTET